MSPRWPAYVAALFSLEYAVGKAIMAARGELGVPFHPAPASVDFDGNIAVAQLGNASLGVLSMLVALAFVRRWGRHVPRGLLALGAGAALVSGSAGAIVVGTSLTGLREDHGQWGIDSLVLGVAPLGAWLLLTLAAVREWRAGRSPRTGEAAVALSPRPAAPASSALSPRPATPAAAALSPRPASAAALALSPRPATPVAAALSLRPASAAALALSRRPATPVAAALSPAPRHARASRRPLPARGRGPLRRPAPRPPRRVRGRRGLRRLRRPEAALGARRRVAPAPDAAPGGRGAGHARP